MNLQTWVHTGLFMRDKSLKDLVLLEVHQCILVKRPVAPFIMLSASGEGSLCLSSHVINIVWAKVVCVQKLVHQPTIVCHLCRLDDGEGVASECWDLYACHDC